MFKIVNYVIANVYICFTRCLISAIMIGNGGNMKKKVDFLLYSDESCPIEHDGNDVMAIGFIYCPQNKKDEIFRELRELKTKYKINTWTEIKWTKLTKGKIDYYKELIDYFYKKDEIGLRILLAKGKTKLNHEKYNAGEYINWYYKMYYFLLNKVIDENYKYFLLFDQKEKETLHRLKQVREILINHKKSSLHSNFDFDIKQINSKESELMQLLDVFLGAVTYTNRNLYKRTPEKSVKDEIIQYIETCHNCRLDEKTLPYETKFNLFIWNPIGERI